MSLPAGGDCTVGVDVGTTAVKAVAVDATGRVVARARVPHHVGAASVDSLEHDVARAWRRGPRRAFSEVVAGLDGPPAGVTVTSMVPSITAVNRRGTPLLPGLLYGDVRARPRGAPGGPNGPDDLGGEREQGRRMIEWAVGAEPGAHGYWNCQAVATHALTGVPAVDGATATSFGGLCRGGRWDRVALEKLGIGEDQVPVIGGMGEKLGSVPGTSTAFAGGSIDAFCEQIVAGAERPGDVLVIFGATLIVWVITEEWKDVPGLTTLPNMVAGQVQIGGPSNAGALFADWARALVDGGRRRGPRDGAGPAGGLRVGDPERVPVWLPYLRGERTPFHDTELRASLHGLDISQGPEALLRAAHEASGFVIRRIIERSGAGATPDRGHRRRVPLGSVDAGGGRRHGAARGHHGGVGGGGARCRLPGPDGGRPGQRLHRVFGLGGRGPPDRARPRVGGGGGAPLRTVRGAGPRGLRPPRPRPGPGAVRPGPGRRWG